MGDKLYEENSVQAIAESIRSKLGVDTTYKIAEMSGAINTIVVPDGTTNITENGYHDVAAYEQAYVHVEGGITPTGTTNIYENGDHDVTDYATAHVAVPQPIGKKTVTENGTDIDIAQYATLDVNVQPNLGTKTVNQNGVYNASDDSLDGYSKVTVNTPVPTGKKTIAANGTDIDVSSYALVDVAVPGIVPTGTLPITDNGTYDVTNYASAIVNVSGGGGGLPSNMTMQIVNVAADTETIEVTYDPTKTVGLVIAVPIALQLSAYEQTFIVGKMSFFSGDFSQLFGTYVNYNHTGEQSGTGSNAGSFTFDSTNSIITIGTKSSTYHFKAGDSFVVFIVYVVQS